MRNANSTTVNVVVIDRQDRTSVVNTLRQDLRRLCIYLREAWAPSALVKRLAQPRFGAMHLASAGSPSWGGHRLSGRSGFRSRS